MFEFGRIGELLIIVIAALILIGPKELPQVLHTFGRWLRKFQTLKENLQQSLEPYIEEGKSQELQDQLNHSVLKDHPPIIEPSKFDHDSK